MSTLYIVFAGPYTVPVHDVPVVPFERQIPDFTGFDEENGVVYVTANVREEHFGEGKLPPVRLIVRVYGEVAVAGFSLEDLDRMSPIVESAVEVLGPSGYRVGVAGLSPGVEYGFVLLAEYPD